MIPTSFSPRASRAPGVSPLAPEAEPRGESGSISYVVPMIEADGPRPGQPARTVLPATQAAVIPYRFRNGRAEILLVTSRTRSHWIVPKGNIGPGMLPHEAARAEAFEEAGVLGTMSPHSFGRYHHGWNRRASVVDVFLFRIDTVLGVWPEMHERSRRWAYASEAADIAHPPGLARLLRRAAGVLSAASAE